MKKFNRNVDKLIRSNGYSTPISTIYFHQLCLFQTTVGIFEKYAFASYFISEERTVQQTWMQLWSKRIPKQ